jgi:hypothetical protein
MPPSLRAILRAIATALHVLRPFCVPSSALYVVASALHRGFESHSLRQPP